jgi:hypothetical protein
MQTKRLFTVLTLIGFLMSLNACVCSEEQARISELEARESQLANQNAELTQMITGLQSENDVLQSRVNALAPLAEGSVPNGAVVNGELVCDSNFADCDGYWTNGCERNTSVQGPCGSDSP